MGTKQIENHQELMKFILDKFEAVDLRKSDEKSVPTTSYQPGPAKISHDMKPPTSNSRYAAKGQEACWSHIRGRC